MRNLFLLLPLTIIGITTITSCKKMGCTDPIASNYDTKAKNEDGSCIYKDINGNSFGSIKIGNQIWMTSDLKATSFRNGDLIPCGQFAAWGTLTSSAFCDFMNEPSKGRLYNWYAVNDSREIAPAGWHIPTDAEWANLSAYLGGDATSGKKLKATSGWNSNGNGSNESGFNGYPGGIREFNEGLFCYSGVSGFWWSLSESAADSAYYRQLGYYHDQLIRGYRSKNNGMSVRCIRD